MTPTTKDSLLIKYAKFVATVSLLKEDMVIGLVHKFEKKPLKLTRKQSLKEVEYICRHFMRKRGVDDKVHRKSRKS